MRVALTSEAKAELAAVLEWYGTQAPRIVRRFIDEFDALTERLADNPRQFPAVRGTMRRAGFRRFPYGLFFRIHPDYVEIVACLYAGRDPRHWQRRAQ
jgi:toxin ParE1/3/4